MTGPGLYSNISSQREKEKTREGTILASGSGSRGPPEGDRHHCGAGRNHHRRQLTGTTAHSSVNWKHGAAKSQSTAESPQARRKGCRTEQTDAQAAVRARRQLEAEVEAGAGRPADRIHRSSPGRHSLTGAPLPRRSGRSGGEGHGDSVLGMGLPPTLPGQKSWGREHWPFSCSPAPPSS